MSMIAKNRIHSTWTPLSNEETNNKIFEERKDLVGKWFQKWNDDQRRKLFEELVGKSKRKQLEYARELIDSRVPCHKDDFTRYLPRVITLYIFSHLDARSLCQCAQVCWYWRYLAELDQLWMPKCLHFGWHLSFTPSPYENGVWKRNFIEQFKIIQALLPKNPPASEMSKLKLDSKRSEKTGKKKSGPTPWRGSDPVPKDTWRFNYLNNDEVLDEVTKCRQKKMYGSATDDVVRNARSKVNSGSNVLNSLSRSHSLTRISSAGEPHLSERPRWARQTTQSSSSGFLHKNAMKHNGVLAKITRPGPVSPPPKLSGAPKSRPVTARSARDPPTTELFPQTPWKVPTNAESDDERE
ncbi:F-box only protein 16 [Aplysia californica]|uniref:F-box only protein 16 n=1 Tax=Aplysia californica TaxID=6500 RepID=A0ABM0K2D5_APLCA|nr:F-box only protein 16 [Aplysia californica]